MTTEESGKLDRSALIRHLARFPEDLRDIRRLQRRFQLSALEVARALEEWSTRSPGRNQPLPA